LNGKGEVIRKQIEDQEGFHQPFVRPQPTEINPTRDCKPPKKANECAQLMRTWVIVINTRNRKQYIKLQNKSSQGHNIIKGYIAKNDSLLSKAIDSTERFVDPAKNYVLEVARKKNKASRTIRLSQLPLIIEDKSKQERFYIYFLFE